MEFIELKERDLLSQALYVFSNKNIDFEDAYNLIFAKNLQVKEFKTFDKKLNTLF